MILRPLNTADAKARLMPSAQMDSLYRNVAKKVLSETLRMKKGECVTVETWNNGLAFAKHVVAETRAMGCTAIMVFEDEPTHVDGVRRSPKESLGIMGKNEYSLLSGSDAYIFIPGPVLSAYSKTLTSLERTDSTKYNMSWYEAAKKAGLRGARMVYGYVGRDMARVIGKNVDDIVKGQLKAALADYGVISRHAGRVASLLGDGTQVSLESGGANLTLALKGEMEVEDGIVDEKDVEEGGNMTYMPPGVVTKEVDPTSVNGTVKVSESITRLGMLHGGEFKLKEGTITGWKTKDRALVEKFLKPLPDEKRRVRTMAVGLNPVLRYGFGQDRFVLGALTLEFPGFNAIVRNASVSAGGQPLMRKGALS